jgi:hypothetical protein
MMVLDSQCKKCYCICNAIHFQQNFEKWTSGNDDIDKLIQDTQLSAHDNIILIQDTQLSAHDNIILIQSTQLSVHEVVLEWIPYDRFYDVKYIIEKKFGKVYKAKWIDGYIDKWDDYSESWIRCNKNMIVTLNNLKFSKSITLKFMNKVL